MKISITLTDDAGETFQGVVELLPSTPNSVAKRKTAPKAQTVTSVDLSLPIRAFIKQYARGLSGPERFTILVAYLSKGQLATEVSSSEIEEQWNKMKPLLGGSELNRAHSTRAKEHGWIDSPSRGKYVIRSTWKGALRG